MRHPKAVYSYSFFFVFYSCRLFIFYRVYATSFFFFVRSFFTRQQAIYSIICMG